MSVDLLERLSRQDVRIWLKDGELRYSAPRHWTTAERLRWLREHKLAILQALQSQPEAATASAGRAEPIHWRSCTPEQLQALWTRVKEGEPILIHSDTLNEAVYWVRDLALKERLQSQGITDVCYTIDELKVLAGKPAVFLRDVHQLKKRFDGRLQPDIH